MPPRPTAAIPPGGKDAYDGAAGGPARDTLCKPIPQIETGAGRGRRGKADTMLTPYLQQLKASADPERAVQMHQYHKVDRVYLGLTNPLINDLTRDWRRALDVADRVQLAAELWVTNIYEARLAAAKLLTQARIRPDAAVWSLIQR